MGPNGAGKSTFIRTLADLIPPLQGTVSIHAAEKGSRLFPRRQFGTADGSDPVPIERAAALVLSNRPDCDYLTVKEVAALGTQAWQPLPLQKLFAWGKKKPRVPEADTADSPGNSCAPPAAADSDANAAAQTATKEALCQTQLWPFRNRRANSLSDGEFRRLMIARAIAQKTPIMLLDEPLAFLDPPHQIEILSLLKRLASRGKTVLFSTHDPSFSLQIADSLLLIPKSPTAAVFFPEIRPDSNDLAAALKRAFPSELLSFHSKRFRFELTPPESSAP